MRSDSNGSDDVNNGFFINKLKVWGKKTWKIFKNIYWSGQCLLISSQK